MLAVIGAQKFAVVAVDGKAFYFTNTGAIRQLLEIVPIWEMKILKSGSRQYRSFSSSSSNFKGIVNKYREQYGTDKERKEGEKG